VYLLVTLWLLVVVLVVAHKIPQVVAVVALVDCVLAPLHSA
jgi:hypothetical protein